MKLFLVEQDLTNLRGKYLTECVVAAPTANSAIRAAQSLEDPVNGWGLVAFPFRLKVTELGELSAVLSIAQARHTHGKSIILAIGTGEDD